MCVESASLSLHTLIKSDVCELRCRRCKNLQHWRWSCKLRVQFYDFQIYTYNTSVVVY
jgi:pyruvate-formate lyase-activating enzyme